MLPLPVACDPPPEEVPVVDPLPEEVPVVDPPPVSAAGLT